MVLYTLDLTSHALDTSTGKPAANLKVHLYTIHADEDGTRHARFHAETRTDDNGRCKVGLGLNIQPEAGNTYKLVFDTKAYFEATARKCFYPVVEIMFEIENPGEHYHIPLLISPFGYTTYRGS